MPLCDYGCGRQAVHQFKNGKWCCSKHTSKCPINRERVSEWGSDRTPWNKGKTGIYSEETLKLMSENSKGIPSWNKGKKGIYSKETLKKISESGKDRVPWNKGKTNHLSEESRLKISEAGKGKVPWNKDKTGIYSEESLAAMRTNSKRENLSPETLKKMSIANSGRVLSEEHKKKISKAHKGIPFTEERKRNIRKSKEHISAETRRKLRKRYLERIEERLEEGHQLCPNFNPDACTLIDEYGKQNDCNFQHAMNGGEHCFKELGYWVDGYDAEKNIVIEVDEAHHFDVDGNLSEKDIRRQAEIEEHTGCEFIRLKI